MLLQSGGPKVTPAGGRKVTPVGGPPFLQLVAWSAERSDECWGQSASPQPSNLLPGGPGGVVLTAKARGSRLDRGPPSPAWSSRRLLSWSCAAGARKLSRPAGFFDLVRELCPAWGCLLWPEGVFEPFGPLLLPRRPRQLSPEPARLRHSSRAGPVCPARRARRRRWARRTPWKTKAAPTT